MSGYTLVTGDCVEAMRAMEPESIDAIVTDPPYGTENGNGYGRRQNYGGTMGRTIAGDSDLGVLAGALPQMARVLRPDAWLAVFCSPKRRHDVDCLLVDAGFALFGECIWNKGPGLGRAIRYGHETIIVAKRGEPVRAADAILSVLTSPALHRVFGGTAHPHEKPIDVMAELVRWCCPRGGVVLDPFTGSGTTGVACIEEGREFIGCELSPEYVEIARRRIEHAIAHYQPGLFTSGATG